MAKVFDARWVEADVEPTYPMLRLEVLEEAPSGATTSLGVHFLTDQETAELTSALRRVGFAADRV